MLHNYGTSNISVGVGAGQSITSGFDNVMMGFNAGNQLSNSSGNVFIGYRAGELFTFPGVHNTMVGNLAGGNATSGMHNSFFGSEAGYKNTTGIENTLLGAHAGTNNLIGKNIVCVGYRAGTINTADDNTYVGHNSGLNSSTGVNNSFLGMSSGYHNVTGHDNTFIGYFADCTPTSTALHNSTAIGANATVLNSDNMILGDNNVNVGIGLSGNTSGPQNKLEINTGSACTSGLRFRTLTNICAPVTNTTTGVLSLNSTGDVVWVGDVGSGSTNLCSPGQNIIPRIDPTNATQLQCSDIFNDFSNKKIGLYTTLPKYHLHGVGHNYFSDNDNLLNVYNHDANYTPHYYTLAAKTQDPSIDRSEACFAIYSNETPLSRDRLTINADTRGYANFWSDYVPTVYRDRVIFQRGSVNNASYYATSPQSASVIMVPDFNEVANTLLNDNQDIMKNYLAKLWVESNDNNPDVESFPCIEAFNRVSYLTDITSQLYAIKGHCIGLQPGDDHINTGGYFEAGNATRNYAVWGEATTTNVDQNIGSFFIANSATRSNLGVYSFVNSAIGNNFGGYFTATGGSNINYGVYATTPVGTCSTGGACTDAAGYFNGALYTTNGPYNTSDAMLKTNIDTLQGYYASNLLKDINVYSFEYDTTVVSGLNLPNGTHYGVLAQELEQLLPTLVKDLINPAAMDSAGNSVGQDYPFKAVNYTELIPILIAGYQKQQKQIDSLVARLDICCPLPAPRNTNPQSNGMSVELENTNAIILFQNDPNPFAENTTITWDIPQTELKGQALNAMLIFYDNNGTVIKTVKVNETGAGSLLVYGSKLSSGIYSYSLVVNGKTISTKRMVKTN